MKILHWNCQGLGSSLTITHLEDIRKAHSPDVMLLVETKNVDKVVYKLAKDIGYQNAFVVPAVESSGGAAFFWNDRVRLSFLGNPMLYYTNMVVEEDANIFLVNIHLRTSCSQISKRTVE